MAAIDAWPSAIARLPGPRAASGPRGRPPIPSALRRNSESQGLSFRSGTKSGRYHGAVKRFRFSQSRNCVTTKVKSHCVSTKRQPPPSNAPRQSDLLPGFCGWSSRRLPERRSSRIPTVNRGHFLGAHHCSVTAPTPPPLRSWRILGNRCGLGPLEPPSARVEITTRHGEYKLERLLDIDQSLPNRNTFMQNTVLAHSVLSWALCAR